ncbi:MAG TPA: ferric reductase-like transmembrane domain-containing protein [Alphaproteobacteria bacterium]
MAAVDGAAKPYPSFPRVKTVVFGLALLPAVILADDYAGGGLARPWKAIIEETGAWSMRFLVLAVCISPLIRLTGLTAFASFRRMIGLFGAFYAALHLVAWMRQYGFDWPFLAEELLSRRYLTVGGIAVLLLAPLAATSADVMHRVLGAVRWRRLHVLIYPTVIAAFIHFEMARGLLRLEVAADAVLLAVAFLLRRRAGAAKSRAPAL